MTRYIASLLALTTAVLVPLQAGADRRPPCHIRLA